MSENQLYLDTDPSDDAFLDLAVRYLDDSLSNDEVAEFHAAMESDRAKARLFIDTCLMGKLFSESLGAGLAGESALVDEAEENSVAPPPIVIPTPLSPLSSALPALFSPGWPLAYLVAAVIVGVGLAISALIYVGPGVHVAEHLGTPTERGTEGESNGRRGTLAVVGRITGMVDCEWEGLGFRVQGSEAANQKSEIISQKSLLHLGDRLALRSGLLEITYDTGARVILQGPVTYEVESPSGGYLSVGKLTAKLEKKSEVSGQRSEPANQKSEIRNQKSFAVRTPTATVTDLGTEFGVEVSNEGLTQVHVLQGVVDARFVNQSGQGGRHRRLTEGQAVEIGQENKAFAVVPFAPGAFARELRGTPSKKTTEASYIQTVLADKPMGYWPLNELPGSRKFLDHSGNNFHGFAMGKIAAGQAGPLSGNSRALALDGDGYIDLGRHDAFARESEFSVEAWIWIDKMNGAGYAVSVLGDNANRIGWGLIAGRRNPYANSDAESPRVLDLIIHGVDHFYFPVSESEILERRWLYVAAAFDRTNKIHFYLNGAHRGSIAARPASVGPVWLQFGCAQLVDVDFWQGRLAHVAVYPRALTEADIRSHYDRRNVDAKEVADKHP